MSFGIVLDDSYSYELMKLLRDEVLRTDPTTLQLWKREGRRLQRKLTKPQKKILGHLVVFDKLYAGTFYLQHTLFGSFKDGAVLDELEQRLCENNSAFNRLRSTGLLDTLDDFGKSPEGTLPWMPKMRMPDVQDHMYMWRVMREFQSLFGALLKKRKILPSTSYFKDYIRRIEGVAFYDDAPSLIGPIRFDINDCLYSYSRSLLTAMRQEIPLLTDVTSIHDTVEQCSRDAKDMYQLLSIVLKDISHIPQPRSLEEAIELQNNELVKQFRTALMSWMHALLSGCDSDEKTAREELRGISSKFKTLSWCGRVSKYVTYLSVPAFVVDLVLTGGFIGTVGMAIGVGSQITVDRKKKRLRAQIIGT